jgi:hypothetical protein
MAAMSEIVLSSRRPRRRVHARAVGEGFSPGGRSGAASRAGARSVRCHLTAPRRPSSFACITCATKLSPHELPPDVSGAVGTLAAIADVARTTGYEVLVEGCWPIAAVLIRRWVFHRPARRRNGSRGVSTLTGLLARSALQHAKNPGQTPRTKTGASLKQNQENRGSDPNRSGVSTAAEEVEDREGGSPHRGTRRRASRC